MKEEIKFPCQLFSKLERSAVLLGLGRITEKRIFVSSAGQVDSTAPEVTQVRAHSCSCHSVCHIIQPYAQSCKIRNFISSSQKKK